MKSGYDTGCNQKVYDGEETVEDKKNKKIPKKIIADDQLDGGRSVKMLWDEKEKKNSLLYSFYVSVFPFL